MIFFFERLIYIKISNNHQKIEKDNTTNKLKIKRSTYLLNLFFFVSHI